MRLTGAETDQIALPGGVLPALVAALTALAGCAALFFVLRIER